MEGILTRTSERDGAEGEYVVHEWDRMKESERERVTRSRIEKRVGRTKRDAARRVLRNGKEVVAPAVIGSRLLSREREGRREKEDASVYPIA